MTLKEFVFKLIEEYIDNIDCCPCECGIPCIYREKNKTDDYYCTSGDCYEGLKFTFKKILETEIDNILKLL